MIKEPQVPKTQFGVERKKLVSPLQRGRVGEIVRNCLNNGPIKLICETLASGGYFIN